MLLKDDGFHLFYNVRVLEGYIVVFVNVRLQVI